MLGKHVTCMYNLPAYTASSCDIAVGQKARGKVVRAATVCLSVSLLQMGSSQEVVKKLMELKQRIWQEVRLVPVLHRLHGCLEPILAAMVATPESL